MPVAPVSAALRALRSSGPQLLCPAFYPPPNNSLSLCGCYRMRRCLLTALCVYDVMMVQVRLKEVPSAASPSGAGPNSTIPHCQILIQ